MWWARPGDVGDGHLALLPATDRARRSRLRRQVDRDRLTVGVALSRLVLAAHLGRPPSELKVDRTCARCGEQHGKPVLIGNDALRFSVSHSGDLVAVAVTRHADVGVDVELMAGHDPRELAATVLAPDERETFDEVPPPHAATAFGRYWTRKEAVLKATGDGLSEPMTALSVAPPDAPAALLRWAGHDDRPARTYLYDLRSRDGHLAAVAFLGGPKSVVEVDAGPLLAGAE